MVNALKLDCCTGLAVPTPIEARMVPSSEFCEIYKIYNHPFGRKKANTFLLPKKKTFGSGGVRKKEKTQGYPLNPIDTYAQTWSFLNVNV